MLGQKNKEKECCKEIKNKIIRSKTPNVREQICKKCGHIIKYL